ncbi:hypothetical protein Tco_0205470 [Tanacetum coccineum]
MASVAPSADQAADLLKNLSIDSQSKTLEVSEAAKKSSKDQCLDKCCKWIIEKNVSNKIIRSVQGAPTIPKEEGTGFLFGYGNENSDGLNELNRGPRARIIKSQKVPTQVTIKGPNGTSPNIDVVEKEKVSAAPDREQYNQTEFPDTYEDAKSIPVYQIVGVAEMEGDPTVQNSCVEARSHPLILTENIPVTNSRDTQEVKLEHGLQVIKIFKDHSSKQCILDDFEFTRIDTKRIQSKSRSSVR